MIIECSFVCEFREIKTTFQEVIDQHLELHVLESRLKLPATSCWESPTVKENVIFYSFANPAASTGECARCSVQEQRKNYDYPFKLNIVDRII
jgi:hypothetical protein